MPLKKLIIALSLTVGFTLAAHSVTCFLRSPSASVDVRALAVRSTDPVSGEPTSSYQIHRRPRWSWMPVEPSVDTVDRAEFLRRAELGTHARGPSPLVPHERDELLILLEPPRENPDPGWIRHLIERFDGQLTHARE